MVNQMEDTIKKIIDLLDEIRPYLISDGGDVEFIEYKDGIVFIRMIGACSQCEFIDVTLKDNIEDILVNQIPEVKEVRQLD